MIIFILLIMIGISYIPKIDEKKKFVSLVVILLFINIISFAYGTDYLSYQYLYNGYKGIGSASTQNIELGFKVLFSFFKSLNVDFYFFAVIFRGFLIMITSKWIYDNSENSNLSLIIYFSLFYTVWSMSALRQGLVLALGTYFVFGKKEYNLFMKVCLILLLSTFHLSALFYLIIIGLQYVRWDKKKHIIFLATGLIVTFVPLYNIVPFFEFIPGVSKISNYLTPSLGFFDTGSIMRLFFFLITIYKYDVITTQSYNKKIVDSFLFGVSLYFYLKFSEITAGRFTIFTFILLVLILPILVNFYNTKISFLPIIAVYAISTFLLVKDFTAYKNQVQYNGNLNKLSIPTIFNIEYKDYDNIYSYIEYRKEESDKYIENVNKSIERKEVSYDPSKKYIVIRDKNKKYGIMDEDGNWLMKPSQNHEIVLYGDVYSLPKKNGIYWELQFYNMDKTEGDSESLERKANDFLQSEEIKTFDQNILDVNVKSIIDFEEFVPNIDNVQNEMAVEIIDGKHHYHVVYFQYYSHHLYIYLDSSMNPITDIVMSQTSLYENGFMKVQTMTGYIIMNSDGKVVWAETIDSLD